MRIPDEWMEECFALVRQGDPAGAAVVAIRGTEANPDEGSGWVTQGLIQYRLGDLAAACQALETASTLIPLDPPTRSVLAECFARTGHGELARHVYEALATDSRTPEALLPAVAAGFGWLGEYHAALQVCRDLVSRRPHMPEAHFGVAFYLRKLGQAPAAVLPVVARAHELAPEVPLYRISLATLLDHLGRREEARELLRGVDLDAVSCRCCVQRMTTIFFAPGEAAVTPDHPDEHA